jgi:hypothetical protein
VENAMFYVYNENQPFSGDFDLKNADPHFFYLRHYGNLKYLQFIFDNTENRVERHQANKEIEIARKKMDWWSKKHGFDYKHIETGKKKIDREWASKR